LVNLSYMKFIIKTTKPKIPVGFRKIKYCTGGYKRSILGKEFENDKPIWAERRVDNKAIFSEDKVYYILYTYVKAGHFSGKF